jgi:hypothetical protein
VKGIMKGIMKGVIMKETTLVWSEADLSEIGKEIIDHREVDLSATEETQQCTNTKPKS